MPRTSPYVGRVSRAFIASAAAVFISGCGIDPGTAPRLPLVDTAPPLRGADDGRVTRYNIRDWVLAQGSYCARPEHWSGSACGPPSPGLETTGWFDRARKLCGFVDYAGFASRYLEQAGGPSLRTSYSGSITERLLSDGRAEVTITLRTYNALALAVPCDRFPDGSVVFGATPIEILAGVKPALGSSFFSLTYIAPPGYALPEPVQVFISEPPYELVNVVFDAQATGLLRAAFGFGEGTLGRLHIQRAGRMTPGPLNKEGDHAGDYFPAENVTLVPMGG